MVILRDSSEKFNKQLLFHLLKSKVVTKQFELITSGSAQPQLTIQGLKKLKLLIPPLPEQQKIADILSTVDSKIELIDEQIKQTQELKKGLMQKLLTGEISTIKGRALNPSEKKDSPLGKIPQEWEVNEINKVTNYVDYRGKTPKKVKEGVLLVTAKNIKKGYIDYNISREYILQEDYASVMGRGVPKLGDVLITTEAPLGNVASIDFEDVALAQRVIKYRGIENVLINSFLKYYMLSPMFQDLLDKESTGSTVKGIKGSRLHKLKIVLPPLKEQQKISTILSTVDDKLEVLGEKKNEYSELKKGLMQVLLTGVVRVKS